MYGMFKSLWFLGWFTNSFTTWNFHRGLDPNLQHLIGMVFKARELKKLLEQAREARDVGGFFGLWFPSFEWSCWFYIVVNPAHHQLKEHGLIIDNHI